RSPRARRHGPAQAAPKVCPGPRRLGISRPRPVVWKAAFWCLVAVAVFSSSGVARATARSEGNGDADTGATQPGAALGAYSQSFQTNLLKGSVSFAIPIALPPGKDGMEPKLALTYSSDAGKAWVGRGWSLGVGEIIRNKGPGGKRPDFA